MNSQDIPGSSGPVPRPGAPGPHLPGVHQPGAHQPGDRRVLLEIRPSSQTYGRGLATRALAMVPLIAIGLFSGNGSSVSPVVRWVIVSAGVLIGVVAIGMMITRVQLTLGSIRVRRLIGTEKEIPRGKVGYGILIQQYEQFANMVAPLLILVDSSRRKLLQLSGQVYAAGDLNALAQAVGIANFDVIAAPVTPKLVDQRHPKVLSIWERRPFLIAFLVVGAVVVLVILFAVLSGTG